MYYETMLHSLRVVDNAMAAAELIRSAEKPATYECLTYKQLDKEIYLVSDVHIDMSDWFEVAVLVKQEGNYYQIESITNGWIKTTAELAKYFLEAPEAEMPKGKASLLIGGSAPSEATAWFTCGCCGNGFRDSVAKQLKYDQDNGYGICTENGCNKYYD